MCDCGFWWGQTAARLSWPAGLQCCTVPGSDLWVSLPCSDMKTIILTVDLTTAPQDECLTRSAHRLRPGFSALTQIVFSAVRSAQQHSCSADNILKEEALSITLSCRVKLYTTFWQLCTGRGIFWFAVYHCKGLMCNLNDLFHMSSCCHFFLKSNLRLPKCQEHNIFLRKCKRQSLKV